MSEHTPDRWEITLNQTGSIVGRGATLREAVMSVDGCAPIERFDFTILSDDEIQRILAANDFTVTENAG
jgi:hypothetical protein